MQDAIPETNKEGEEGLDEDIAVAAPAIVPTTTAQTFVFRPPKRIVNPYDEFLKEQEKILQARREAKEKYTKISATQNAAKKA